MFRSINNQKLHARMLGSKCRIWGKPAEFIVGVYETADGQWRENLLLCSGWWGWSRHANYVADLLLSYSTCALAGTTKVIVWAYAIWMTLLLVHRCLRDERPSMVFRGTSIADGCRGASSLASGRLASSTP